MIDDGDDRDAIASVRSGRREAYSLIVRRYQRKVRGYCFHALLDHGLAEDAAQEVFFKAFQHLGTFRGESLFSTWLFQITVNHCRDVLRQRVRTAAESWDALPEQERERAERTAEPPGPGFQVESRDAIVKVLARLSPEYREVLILREAEDCSYEQIAAIVGCTLDAVKSRLRRARAEIVETSRHFFDDKDVRMRRGGT